MVRLQLSLQLDYEVYGPGCDFVFNIHAAHTARQRVLHDTLTINQNVPSMVETDPATGNRYLRLTAMAGHLSVRYETTVDIEHHFALPADVPEVIVPLAAMPALAVAEVAVAGPITTQSRTRLLLAWPTRCTPMPYVVPAEASMVRFCRVT